MGNLDGTNVRICIAALLCVAIMVATSLCCLCNVINDDRTGDDGFVGEKERFGEYLVTDGNIKKDRLIYEIEDDEHVKVVDYDGGYRDIIVPDEVEDDGHKYTVDRIAEWGLSAHSPFGRVPWTVEIGPKIEEICASGITNQNVLWGDHLTHFGIRDIENSKLVSIGESAFEKCQFESVILPDSLREIGEAAFCWNEKLGAVYCDSDSVTVGDFAFCECTNLCAIDFYYMKSIGKNAFSNCNALALDLTIIENIGEKAFDETKIRRVSFGQSLTSIGKGAFNQAFKNANGKFVDYTDVSTVRGRSYRLYDHILQEEVELAPMQMPTWTWHRWMSASAPFYVPFALGQRG